MFALNAVQFPQQTRGDRPQRSKLCASPLSLSSKSFGFVRSPLRNFPSDEVRNQLVNIYISVSLEPSRSETPHAQQLIVRIADRSTETVKSRSTRSGNTARVTSLANDVTRVFFSTVSTSAHPHLLAREQNKHLSEPASCWSLVSLRCTGCWDRHKVAQIKYTVL